MKYITGRKPQKEVMDFSWNVAEQDIKTSDKANKLISSNILILDVPVWYMQDNLHRSTSPLKTKYSNKSVSLVTDLTITATTFTQFLNPGGSFELGCVYRGAEFKRTSSLETKVSLWWPIQKPYSLYVTWSSRKDTPWISEWMMNNEPKPHWTIFIMKVKVTTWYCPPSRTLSFFLNILMFILSTSIE